MKALALVLIGIMLVGCEEWPWDQAQRQERQTHEQSQAAEALTDCQKACPSGTTPGVVHARSLTRASLDDWGCICLERNP